MTHPTIKLECLECIVCRSSVTPWHEFGHYTCRRKKKCQHFNESWNPSLTMYSLTALWKTCSLISTSTSSDIFEISGGTDWYHFLRLCSCSTTHDIVFIPFIDCFYFWNDSNRTKISRRSEKYTQFSESFLYKTNKKSTCWSRIIFQFCCFKIR